MSRQPVQEFIKGLEKLDRSYSTGEKFRDLMEMAYCAHAKLMAPTPEQGDALEARYMQIVNRYQDKDTIRAYPDLMALAWETVAAGGCDFLGEVSSELAVLNVGNGQFFTPYEVSRLIAEMNLHDLDKIIEQDGYFTLSEPTVGAGGMVLAAADVVERMGYNPAVHMLVQAVDISALAYYMSYLQLTWRGITAAVIHGNSLSLEVFESAWTVTAHYFKSIHGHLSFDKPQQPTAPQEQIEIPTAPVQLTWSF